MKKFVKINVSILMLAFFPIMCTCNSIAKDNQNQINNHLKQIKLPSGFHIQIYADNVKGARSLALGAFGTLFVGTRKEGKVYALVDEDKDHRIDKIHTIVKGLTQPNGVAFSKGDLFVAEINKIWKYENIEKSLSSPPRPILITNRYPDDTRHGWKFIAFGPDGKLYIPVGAPCNICLSSNDIFASITRLNLASGKQEIFAKGIRNTVGFDWHPDDKALWFTDNGRDWLGDNQPPDELNRAPQKGLHFGYPYCHGGEIADPKFGAKRSCNKFIPPKRKLGPHVAALGMRFYTGTMFPEAYRKDIFIAEHGSWNRSTPIGYRLTHVKLNGNTTVTYDVFAQGWLQENSVWGRPVDLLMLPDGSLVVSDDHAGVIYRIYYQQN
ncbi:MAG: PQQ-dependent sugar dehydrogenase [Desulfobacteraceae bacterium]|jgi:glucose/arabinose dehydrogenase